MTTKQTNTIKRYPHIARALLAVSEDTDTNWAAAVIDSAKNHKSVLSTSLIREAYRKRHSHKSTIASYAVREAVEQGNAA